MCVFNILREKNSPISKQLSVKRCRWWWKKLPFPVTTVLNISSLKQSFRLFYLFIYFLHDACKNNNTIMQIKTIKQICNKAGELLHFFLSPPMITFFWGWTSVQTSLEMWPIDVLSVTLQPIPLVFDAL